MLYKTMDLSRCSSLVALDAAYRRGASRLPAGPLEVYVEVAARCNLRCQMCPITVDPRYQEGSGGPGLLAGELFARLEALDPAPPRVYLQGLGEPTLHPHLVAYTERLAAAGSEVWITTNATLIDEELADALARAGLARVTVSIDGATATTYERIRRRGRFADVVRGLRALGAARRRHGRPILFLSLVGMASNLHELDALVDLCAEVGGDGVSVEALYVWQHPDIEGFAEREHLGNLDPARVAALMGAARRRAVGLGLAWWSRLDEVGATALVPPVPAARPAAGPPAGRDTGAPVHGPARAETPAPAARLPWACSEPWSTMVVNAAGEVRTCCFNDTVLGNVTETPLAAIWNGAAYGELRRQHAAGEVPAGCDHCVRSGRVKRSAVLSWQATVPGAEAPPATDAWLAAPHDGELVGDTVVVIGTLPHAAADGRPGRSVWSLARRPSRQPARPLPEVWIDDTLVACLDDCAIVERRTYAAVVPIAFVSPGAHELTLRAPAALGGGVLALRHLQVARPELPDDTVAAVHRLALPCVLARREGAPRVLIDGAPRRPAAWLCRPYGEAFLGVALLDLDALAPGGHQLELRLRHDPARTLELWRIAPS